MRKVLIVVSVALLMPRGAEAQWLNYPDPRIPRTADGQPALTALAPRAFDGKPDLSGVWHVQSESLEEKRRLFGPDFGTIFVPGMEPTTTSKYGQDVLVDYRPGEIAMTPEADAIYMRRRRGQEISPTEQCLPAGVPRATLLSEVHKIGRPLPNAPSPSWLGYSVGRWDGDTLVVDTIGFNDRAWLDSRGHPRSEAMHTTEKYRRRDVGHMDVEITMDDPKSYNRPITFKVTHLLQADSDILEYVCNENEKDRVHMVR